MLTISTLLAAVALVSGGKPQACFVVPADAPHSQKFVAAEFARWTKELTGAELPVGETAAPGLTPISFKLGDADVRYDGFKLTASKEGVVISAQEPVGLTYGAFWILNRFGKIYWFTPDSGADFTKTDTFELPEGTILKNTMYDRQGKGPGAASGAAADRVSLWNIRNGLKVMGKLTDKIREDYGLPLAATGGGHAFGDMVAFASVDPAELEAEIARIKASGEATNVLTKVTEGNIKSYALFNLNVKKTPWRFPLIKGRRCPTGSGARSMYKGGFDVGNPCLSNPETRQYVYDCICRDRAKCREGGKKVHYTYRMLCDDNSQWCECDECMKLIKDKGSSSKDDRASDYWWDLVNWLAPKLLEDPDTDVNVGIYLTYRQVPERVKPQVADPVRESVVVCVHGRCYLHDLQDKSCKSNARFVKLISDWEKTGIHIKMYEYHNQLPGKARYAFWEKSWVKDLKYYADHNISESEGSFFGPWVGWDSWGDTYKYGARACWQHAWLTSRFEWDPQDDYEAVHADMLARYYRAAAPEMAEYHKLLEEAIFKAGICMAYGSSDLPFTVASAEPGLMDQAKKLLCAAEKKAEGDEELKRRIDLDKLFFALDWEAAAARAGNQKSRPLARAVGAVKLDGVLDEAVWAKATVSDDWRWQRNWNVDAAQTEPMVPNTKMRLAYDDENLYIAVENDKTDGYVKDVPPKGDKWDAMSGSHLQFAIFSPSLKGEYFLLALSHDGKTFGALAANPNLVHHEVKCEFRHAIKDEPDRWTAELAIPLKPFTPPAAGEVWKMCALTVTYDKDGNRKNGTSTGFPLHWVDGMEGFSFGEAACGKPEPKISVFASFIRRISQERGISKAAAADLLYALGVRGYDCGPWEKDLDELAATKLKPINFYYFMKDFGPGRATTNALCLAQAKKYGIPRIMTIPPDFTEGGDEEAEFARTLAGMKAFVAQAKDEGITVTIEDYGGTANPCSQAKYLKRMLDEIPDLRYALDSGNLYFAGRGEDILDMMAYAKDRIAHVHLKDQTAENNRAYATLGLGAVPNEKIVKETWAAGYDGWYTLENAVGDTYLDTVRQTAVLRTWISELSAEGK